MNNNYSSAINTINFFTIKAKAIGSKKNLYQIDFLRGAASLSVCMFHLVRGNPSFLENSHLTFFKYFSYGWLGVQVFFIISGFIICYSLPVNYKLNNFSTFLKKRLVRVEPSYLISILLTLTVAYIAALVTHNTVSVSYKNLLYHLGYLNNFTTNTYINNVYWTLGIEFQFYILIGLLFPLFNKSVCVFMLIIIGLLALSYIRISNTSLIFEHLPLFCIGILIYFILYDDKYPKPVLLLLSAITLMAMLSNIVVFVISLITISIIIIPFPKNKVFSFFSAISYPLYLVHIPIGGRVINLSLRFAKTDFQKDVAIITALLISIIAAYLFHIVIEKPTISWSKKIKYSICGET